MQLHGTTSSSIATEKHKWKSNTFGERERLLVFSIERGRKRGGGEDEKIDEGRLVELLQKRDRELDQGNI